MISRAVLLVAALRASAAAAVACEDDIEAFTGTFHRGARCGMFIGETDGSTIGFSFAKFYVKRNIEAPFELTITAQRLDVASRSSLEIHTPAGAVLFRDGQIGFYVSEAQFEQSGWRALPGFVTRFEHSYRVILETNQITVWIDRRRVGRWPLTAASATAGPISFAFKGRAGHRGKVRFGHVHGRRL